MYAWATVDRVMPTLSVPGISASSTRRNCRKRDVVVAKEPMPSVSKNAVMKPVAAVAAVGRATMDVSRARSARHSAQTKKAVNSPSATNKYDLAVTSEVFGQPLLAVVQADAEADHGQHEGGHDPDFGAEPPS